MHAVYKIKIIVYLGLLLVANSPISAQWQPKLVKPWEPGYLLNYFQFIDENEAYATPGGSYLFHTGDNWKTHSVIQTGLPGAEIIEYFKFIDDFNAILVTRSTDYSLYGGAVYVSGNGGYAWKKVITIPSPSDPINSYAEYERPLVDWHGDRLFVCLGNWISHGQVDGTDWKSVKCSSNRWGNNSDFRVLNENTWWIDCGWLLQTNDNGLHWNASEKNLFSLGDKYLKLEDDAIYEYDANANTWTKVSEKFAMSIKEFRVLSDRYLLVFSWNWYLSVDQYSVYDHQNNTWTDLAKPSALINARAIFPKGGGFVADINGMRWAETGDYGQSHAPMPNYVVPSYHERSGITFNDSIQFFFSYNYLYDMAYLFSTDKGENWKTANTAVVNDHIKLIENVQISNENDFRMFLMSNGYAFLIHRSQDSFWLEPKDFPELNGDKIIGISDHADGKCYLITANKFDTKNLELSFYEYSPGNANMVFRITKNLHNYFAGFKIIQNEKYVLFSLENVMYCFHKDTRVLDSIELTTANPVNSLEFISDNSAYASAFGNLYRFSLFPALSITENMGTNYMKQVVHRNDSTYYGISLYGDNVFVGMPTNMPVDTTYGHFDILNEIRTWKGTCWLSGRYNIYKQEIRKEIETQCIHIEKIYPIPFSNDIHIRYQIQGNQELKLRLYNVLGELVKTAQEVNNTGLYDYDWDLSEISAGLYFMEVMTSCERKVVKIQK